MPSPHAGEARRDFVSRCMGDPEARADFPEQAQRAAFCNSVWERAVKKQATSDVQVAKVDTDLGLVFGFAIVSTVAEQPHFDLQGDHCPEDVMLREATKFMETSRPAKEMHRGDGAGQVVFAFPLTVDIAKALEIETQKTGLMIAMKPTPEVLTKFADGTYTGFSIGGIYGEVETVA